MWQPKNLLYVFLCWIKNSDSWVLSPDSNVHRANMGPIWGRQDPGGPLLAPWTLLSGNAFDCFPINKLLRKLKRHMIVCTSTCGAHIVNFLFHPNLLVPVCHDQSPQNQYRRCCYTLWCLAKWRMWFWNKYVDNNYAMHLSEVHMPIYIWHCVPNMLPRSCLRHITCFFYYRIILVGHSRENLDLTSGNWYSFCTLGL